MANEIGTDHESIPVIREDSVGVVFESRDLER
jgi:hypothetical protein